MRKNNEYSWKAKIDPAFDKPIKEYVAFLEELERSPREGQLNFPEGFMEEIIKKSGGNDSYEGELY